MIELLARSRWLAVGVGIGLFASACSGGDSSAEAVDTTSVVTSSSVPTTTTDVVASTTTSVVTTVAPTPAVPNGCEIVDEVDATELLGSEARIDGPAGADCAWITDSGALLVVIVANGSQFYPAALEGSEPLEIGDDAWILVEDNFGGTQVHVLQGEWVLSLSMAAFGVVDIENLPEKMAAVAERASSRLP